VVSDASVGNLLSSDFLNLRNTLAGGRNVTVWGKYIF
jgi:hypothetical protein